MTARSSTGNFSKFGTYFLYKLRTIRPLIILNSIFALLSYPLVGGILVPYAANTIKIEALREELRRTESYLQYGYSYYDDPAYQVLRDREDVLEGLLIMAVIIGVIMLIGMFIMSYGILSKSFRWLYRKTIVDMDYSLPVSDDTRFFGDLLASFAGSLVPHLIAIFTGSILWRVFANIMLGNEAEMEEYAELMNSLIPEQFMYTGLFSCIMFMAFSLFVMSLCGRSAEAHIYPFVITGVVPLIHVICMLIVLMNTYGYEMSGDISSEFRSIAATSPLGLIFMSIYYLLDANVESAMDFRTPMFNGGIGIIALLITIGLFVAAYFLIRKRRAERVGSPYVFGIVKPAIPAVVTFAVVSCFMLGIFAVLRDAEEYSYTPSVVGIVMAMVIITFIMYVIMELISGKGFKKFHITLLKYIVTMVASILICFGLNVSNGFGLANYVPDAEDVSSVSYTVYRANFNNRKNFTVTEPENIKMITELHREIPKERQTDEHSCHISIDYEMKDGGTVSRMYYITKEQYDEYVRRSFNAEGLFSHEVIDYVSHWADPIDIFRIDVYDWQDYGTGDLVDIPFDEFAEAYRKDCDNATFEQAYGYATGTRSSEICLHYTYMHDDAAGENYTSSMNVNIYSWNTNVLKLLAEQGITYVFDEIGLNYYKSAFVVEYDADRYNGYFNSDENVGFILAGDDSFPEEKYEEYGLTGKYIYHGEYIDEEYYEEYGYEENTVTSYITTAPYVVDEEYYYAEIDYRMNKVDITDPKLRELLENCSYAVDPTYSGEKLYFVLLTTAENLNESIIMGSRCKYCVVAEENAALAQELMAKYPNPEN